MLGLSIPDEIPRGPEIVGPREQGRWSSGLGHWRYESETGRHTLTQGDSRSFRTRDRAEDWNATPLRTTSRFSPVLLIGTGRLYGAGRGETWFERDRGL